jgi:hypothetical protein
LPSITFAAVYADEKSQFGILGQEMAVALPPLPELRATLPAKAELARTTASIKAVTRIRIFIPPIGTPYKDTELQSTTVCPPNSTSSDKNSALFILKVLVRSGAQGIGASTAFVGLRTAGKEGDSQDPHWREARRVAITDGEPNRTNKTVEVLT